MQDVNGVQQAAKGGGGEDPADKAEEGLRAPLLNGEEPTITSAQQPPSHLALWNETLLTEAGRVMQLATPIVLSSMLSFGSYLITTAQAGQLGGAALSAFTLTRTMYHITGLSLVVGLGSATDTFAGQAFGSGQFKAVGIFLQRASTLNLLVALLVIAGWWFKADALMLLLGQDETVVPMAAHLLRLMSPALLLWSVMSPAHSYFSSQGAMKPLALLACVGIVATPLVNHFFIYVLGFGIEGLAIAYNCLALLELLGLMIAMVWLHHQQPEGAKTWTGLDLKAACSAWWPYLQIALPSMGAICADWWVYEVVILLAGLRKDAAVELGAMGVLFATHSLAFMFSSAFGTAATTRVSNELGAGHGAAARRATIVCAVSGLLICMPVGLGLFLGREQWALIYTHDEQVARVIVNSMFFMAFSVVSDSINAVLSGVLRGCGHQTIGLAVNLSTLWLIGIPLAYKLDVLDGMGARGIWMALAGVSVLQATVQLCVVGAFMWDNLARRAQLLVASGHGIATDNLGGHTHHHGVYEEPLLS